jgi:hypothetical protein
MSYSAGEALWLTRLRALSQFNTSNSTRGKFGIRNSGKSDHYAILVPGPWDRTYIGMNTRMDTFRTIIQLWQRYIDDGTTMTDLEALVDAVLAELDTYPRIGDTTGNIIDAAIVEVRELQMILAEPGGGPAWLLVELVGEWHEQTAVTFAE